MLRNTLKLLLGSLLLFGCGSSENSIRSYLGHSFDPAKLDAFLEKEMENNPIPGLTAVVLNDGEVVYHTVKGLADVDQGLPVTEETIFEAASISKSIFAHFVMTYVEAGQLDLDRPLYEYWPYPDAAHDERYKQITARMVLSHRSGFPNWRADDPAHEGQLKILFDPGTSYNYSGEGYVYLAEVLKHMGDGSWAGLEAEFQRRIGEPFGLLHTVFITTPYTQA
ncbi:MAG TPA: serine hydrolase, partial [Cytophagales bacterium]|nr:serine hydrolase [Cytophagales bacterium]